MDYYLSQIVAGIATGSVYGIVGLAIMFIYRSTRVINFAQGEFATLSMFIALALMAKMPTWAAVVCTLGFAFVLGVTVEAGILKRIKDRTELNIVIATVGLLAIVNGLDTWIFGSTPHDFPTPVDTGTVTFHGVLISYQSLWTVSCTCLLSLLLFLLFRFTNIGLAFRAVSEDQISARLKGIRVTTILALSWGLAAVVGVIGAMLIAPTIFVYTNMMSAVLLYAFAAAVVGGLQTSFGALVGGVLIGVAENLAGTVEVIGSEGKIVVVYLVLTAFLMIKPRGLFGRRETRKV